MMSEQDGSLDDRLDALVAQYADRVASGNLDAADLLDAVEPAHRAALERCFKMVRAGAAPERAPVQPLVPGAEVEGFRLVKEIGRGGMAVVFEALQIDLERRVALKFLRPGLALDARQVDRFRREALAIARLQHPGIVQVHAVGGAAGQPFIAMELIDGTTLAQALQDLPTDRTWTAADLATSCGAPTLAEGTENFDAALFALIEQVALAVEAAHEVGIVHRDLKPSNILIARTARRSSRTSGWPKATATPACL